MSRYLVPALLSAILIAVLVAVNRGAGTFLEYMGPGFTRGFIAGIAFTVVMYGLACWIDPASRPRGTRTPTDQ